VCRLLINAGAKIGEEEADGNTALHIACLYKWPAVVKLLLLEKAADVAKPNAAGQTPKALVVDLSVDDEDAPMRQMDTFGAIREAEVHRRQLEAHRVAAASETPKTRSNAPSPGIPRRTPTVSCIFFFPFYSLTRRAFLALLLECGQGNTPKTYAPVTGGTQHRQQSARRGQLHQNTAGYQRLCGRPRRQPKHALDP